eukprot:101272-Rhodomonas_salina.1
MTTIEASSQFQALRRGIAYVSTLEAGAVAPARLLSPSYPHTASQYRVRHRGMPYVSRRREKREVERMSVGA